MTWSYSRDPSSSTKDLVRCLIGDVDADDPQLEDEEINYLIYRYEDPYYVAAQAVRILLARYARLTDEAVGDAKISHSQRQAHYHQLHAELMRQYALSARPAMESPHDPLFEVTP